MSSSSSEDDQDGVESSQEAEELHFRHVLRSFEEYRKWSLAANSRRKKDLYQLSERHQILLSSYRKHLFDVDDRIRQNGDFIDLIVDGASEFGYDTDTSSVEEKRTKPVTRHEAEKVRSTLRQFVRDWSVEGKEERDACYGPLLASLERYLKPSSDVKVLVPGAGLGRLAWEIAMRGYSSIGNEWSFFMLMGSNLILNRTTQVGQYTLYPYIHSFSNQPSAMSMLRPIQVPDVLPSTLFSSPRPGSSESVEFGMVAGDWVEIYSKRDQYCQYDAVVTAFFIDTAHNVLDYLDIIWDVLKVGGIWINIGPTLWHYQDSDQDVSIELTVEQVKSIAWDMGFTLYDENTFKATYAADTQNNLTSQYQVDFWVATKPPT